MIEDNIKPYLEYEQKNTLFDLNKRIMDIGVEPFNDIVVEFDALELTPEKFNYIAQFPDILKDSGEVGEMELDIFKITINKLKTYEEELIVCER